MAKTTATKAAASKASKTSAPKSTKTTVSKVSKTSKSTTKKAATPSKEPESVPTVAPVAESTPEVETKSAAAVLQDDFTSFFARFQQCHAYMSGLRTEFRGLERRLNRVVRDSDKAGKKRQRRKGDRAPSGFVKPTLISNELATFLGKDSGTEMARTEVTREINAYIRQHDLQDKNNGRIIKADKKLSDLLSLKASDELTYFNLQRYMSPHFPKSSSNNTTSSA